MTYLFYMLNETYRSEFGHELRREDGIWKLFVDGQFVESANYAASLAQKHNLFFG